MKLIQDWKLIIQKAWSAKLMYLAALLSGGEAILPLITDSIPWPRWASALLVMVVVAGAFVARLMAQPKLDAAREQASKESP